MSLKIKLNNDSVSQPVPALETRKKPLGIKVPEILSKKDAPESSFKIIVTQPSSDDSTESAPPSAAESRKSLKGGLQLSAPKGAPRGPSRLEQLRREAFEKAEHSPVTTPSPEGSTPPSAEESRYSLKGGLQLSAPKGASRGPSRLEQLRREAFEKAEHSPVTTPSPEGSTPPSAEESRKSLKGGLQLSAPKGASRGPSRLEQLRREAFEKAELSPAATPSSEESSPPSAEESPLPTKTVISGDLDAIEAPSWDSDFVQNKTASYRSSADFDFMRSLPVDFADFNRLMGADLGRLELEDLRISPLGQLLQGDGYTIVEALKTDGANSYRFSIRKTNTEEMLFLKIIKPKNWDRLSLRNCVYSKQDGIGWLMANKDGLSGVAVPHTVIGVNSKGQLTQECEEGSLILATLSPMIKGQNLKSLFAQGKIRQESIPQLITNMLAAVLSFKQKHLIHRDLNPENFLVDPDTLEVMIIDFDESTTQLSKLKEGGDGGGIYLPPEGSVKMDEFTLGLVFFEMCTGLKPSDIPEGYETSVKKEVLAGRIPLDSIPENLRMIAPVIEGLLQVDSEKRWDTGHALEVWQKITDSEG